MKNINYKKYYFKIYRNLKNLREFYKISNNFLNSWGFHEV